MYNFFTFPCTCCPIMLVLLCNIYDNTHWFVVLASLWMNLSLYRHCLDPPSFEWVSSCSDCWSQTYTHVTLSWLVAFYAQWPLLTSQWPHVAFLCPGYHVIHFYLWDTGTHAPHTHTYTHWVSGIFVKVVTKWGFDNSSHQKLFNYLLNFGVRLVQYSYRLKTVYGRDIADDYLQLPYVSQVDQNHVCLFSLHVMFGPHR